MWTSPDVSRSWPTNALIGGLGMPKPGVVSSRREFTRISILTLITPHLSPTIIAPKPCALGALLWPQPISNTHECSLRWHTMPQYHDDDAQASCSSKATPFPHRCCLCKQLQPRHTVWDCPARKDCHYCKGRNHLSENCNNPHALCFTKSECVVPFTHRHALSRMACRCPAAHLHSRYYTDDWGYDGEDTTYDDYDWEA